MEENEKDYSGWLIEDLRQIYKQTLKDRDGSESYSDRSELNVAALKMMAEIQKRNDDG